MTQSIPIESESLFIGVPWKLLSRKKIIIQLLDDVVFQTSQKETPGRQKDTVANAPFTGLHTSGKDYSDSFIVNLPENCPFGYRRNHSGKCRKILESE